MIANMTRENRSDDVGPDSAMELDRLDAVEAAPDYHVELSVPLTVEQLAALERIAGDRGISPAQAAQRLVEDALAGRARR